MRLMTFDKDNDLIHVRTIAPYSGTEEKDEDSRFTRPWFREVSASRIYDFNNDGKSELAMYRNGKWLIEGQKSITFGTINSIPVPGNYYGNGKTYPAVYDTTRCVFSIMGQDDIQWGMIGDIPMPADYDGDGITDIAVWRPSNQTLYIYGQEPIRFGELPAFAPGDYDGDGKVELAIYKETNYSFHITGLGKNIVIGKRGDIPVPADYNGDGKTDIAVYRPSTGEWIVFGKTPVTFGGDTYDIPVPGDYDGTGKVQFAVYNLKSGILTNQSGKQIKLKGQLDEIVNIPHHTKLYIKHLKKQ